jgi:hypothetical protein
MLYDRIAKRNEIDCSTVTTAKKSELMKKGLKEFLKPSWKTVDRHCDNYLLNLFYNATKPMDWVLTYDHLTHN